MTNRLEVYKCMVCGNIVEILHSGMGELVCCGQPMVIQKENVVDASLEKHVPVVSNDEGDLTVRVGQVDHPMEEKHFIEWIEVIGEGFVYREYLEPNMEPGAVFYVDEEDEVTPRAYCNIHGLWKG
jgi:superoxide reductase